MCRNTFFLHLQNIHLLIFHIRFSSNFRMLQLAFHIFVFFFSFLLSCMLQQLLFRVSRLGRNVTPQIYLNSRFFERCNCTCILFVKICIQKLNIAMNCSNNDRINEIQEHEEINEWNGNKIICIYASSSTMEQMNNKKMSEPLSVSWIFWKLQIFRIVRLKRTKILSLNMSFIWNLFYLR